MIAILLQRSFLRYLTKDNNVLFLRLFRGVFDLLDVVIIYRMNCVSCKFFYNFRGS